MSPDPRIDAYIARQAEFARPILEHLRSCVHAACPEASESIKWGAPAFLYKDEILAIMAALKAHAVFNLWRGKQVTGGTGAEEQAMGQFGRITSIADAPDAETIGVLIRKAMALADAGLKPPRAPKSAPKAAIAMPDDFAAALASKGEARSRFAAFSPSARRDYLEWITSAKQPATRARRIAQAAEWIAEGKKRNWKYEAC